MRVSIMTKVTRTTNVMATVVFRAIFLQRYTCEDPSPKDETILSRGQSSLVQVSKPVPGNLKMKLKHLPTNHPVN